MAASRPYPSKRDTGAVISLLRRSVADLLGLDSVRGHEVELGAVGGMPVKARVHKIRARFVAGSRPYRPGVALVAAFCLHGRILLTIVDAKKIVAEASDYDFLRECEKGVV